MFSWLRVLVVNLNLRILTVVGKKIRLPNLAVTILKKKKIVKTTARLAKPAVPDSFFQWF